MNSLMKDIAMVHPNKSPQDFPIKIWELTKKMVKNLLLLLAIMLIIRLCFFDIFRVPSNSMENRLKEGDLIITNKILYSGTFSKLFSNLNIKSSPLLNDILVFKLSPSDTSFYVKRCICLPGKTIEINNGKVFIDRVSIIDPVTVRHLYQLWYTHYDLIEKTLNNSKIDLFANEFQKRSKHIMIYLDDFQKRSLLGKPGIDSINILGANGDHQNARPHTLGQGNTIQNLKPFLIPFAGMRIKLDSNTLVLYKNLLLQDEGVNVEQRKRLFFINGAREQYYVFKKDYYFMMGDNRDNSIDSRIFGPIPREYIEGKVVLKI